MKPAQTLFSLLTLAVAGVGLVSGQFITSRTTAPVVAPRSSDVAATIAARQDTDTVRRTVTRTVVQSSSRSSSSTRPRTSSSTRNSGDDDDDDGTTTRRTSQTRSQTSTSRSTTTRASTTSTRSSTTTTTTAPSTTSQSPSETAPPSNQPKTTGLSAGAAAGIAAGAVALVAIIAAAAFLLWRRRQGGIRGAVITADYPQGMSSMSDGEPKLSPLPPPAGGEVGQQQQGAAYPGIANGGVGLEERRPSTAGVSGETLYKYPIPPAGTMPGEAAFEQPGDEYLHPYPNQQEQQQQWLQSPDPTAPRPVSSFPPGTYPSPGQPVLPVSPITPYRPESGILTPGQHHQQPQQQQPLPLPLQQQSPRTSSYHPGMTTMTTMMMGSTSPDLPTYLIPGGNRSRAMSFSSVAHFGGGGGGPHVAELVGSPPLPQSRPSMMVVVEGGGEGEGEPAARRSYGELP